MFVKNVRPMTGNISISQGGLTEQEKLNSCLTFCNRNSS